MQTEKFKLIFEDSNSNRSYKIHEFFNNPEEANMSISTILRYNGNGSENVISIRKCTGLTDKHGFDIFEGDILQYSDADSKTPVKVIWDAPKFMLSDMTAFFGFGTPRTTKQTNSEIIGCVDIDVEMAKTYGLLS